MNSVFNFLLVLVVVPGLGLSALADNKIGNGGDAVLCKNGKKSSARLLDFYEEKINFEPKDSKPEAIAEKQLQLLKPVAPKLAELYLKRLKEISSEIDFRGDIQLTDIQDSAHLFKPREDNCQVLQLAIRKVNAKETEKRFLIREDLWKLLTPLHKAGLLTHEIIYEHFMKLGEKDSVKARQMNRYLYQTNLDAEKFWKFVQDLEIPVYP